MVLSKIKTSFMSACLWRIPLVEGLARFAAPTKSIRWPPKRNHADPVVGRIATGITGDHNHIAGLQRFASHALSAKLSGAAPLHGPPLHHALLIGCFDVDE